MEFRRVLFRSGRSISWHRISAANRRQFQAVFEKCSGTVAIPAPPRFLIKAADLEELASRADLLRSHPAGEPDAERFAFSRSRKDGGISEPIEHSSIDSRGDRKVHNTGCRVEELIERRVGLGRHWCARWLTEQRSAGMMIDAAGERSEQGRFRSKAPAAATRC